jgi:hypothetical protein
MKSVTLVSAFVAAAFAQQVTIDLDAGKSRDEVGREL